MLLPVLAALVFSLFFYVQAFKYALSPKRWAMIGLLAGPIALPLFNVYRHLAWRRAVGFNNVSIRA